jgi:hypothetical protein
MAQGGQRFKKPVARALGDFVNRTLDPLIAKQGFGEATLLTQWPDVVGARVAEVCQPVRLSWPPRAKLRSPDKPQEPATLTLRVEPGFGLDVQHMSGNIVERVNAHLGWRCVGKLTLRQEPLRHEAPKLRRAAPQDAAARARAAQMSEGVADEALRAALTTLGERVMAGKGKRGGA